jgi:hypothetical protein
VEFWASSEGYQSASDAIEKVRRSIEPILQQILDKSRFSDERLLIRYVPIVMPFDLLDRYPARSKPRIKQRILDCAPQLNYDVFNNGSFTEQVEVYLDGIRTASYLLQKFGFSAADVTDFEMLLVKAGELALAN